MLHFGIISSLKFLSFEQNLDRFIRTFYMGGGETFLPQCCKASRIERQINIDLLSNDCTVSQ